MNSPFNNSGIRNWFFNEIEIPELGIKDIVTLGSGPFEEYEFDEFLKSHGFNVCAPSETIETLIVGGDKFDESAVLNVLKLRAGKTLRVYTQEMFLSYLASGSDPLNSKTGIHKQFAEGHLGIEFLLSIRFDFPTTDIKGFNVESGSSGEEPPYGQEVSMLRYFGYTVGRNGKSESDRRDIISFVFKRDLSTIKAIDQQYIKEWGEAETPQRLSKIVNLISINCRKSRRRTNGDMSMAIEDYESDLKWIKEALYKPYGFEFSWPYINL